MVAALVFVSLLLVQVSTQHSVVPRITNGIEATPSQFPFVASIQFSSLFSLTYFHVCGATVIDKHWVLTSAMCINKIKKFGRSRVKIGMYFTYKKNVNVQTIKIARKYIHEKFNRSSESWNNDIGLVKLKTAIINYESAVLPKPRSKPSGQVLIVGWGVHFQDDTKLSEVLQYGYVDIIDRQSCQPRLSDLRPPVEVHNSQICTYSADRPTVACLGDGGGPVLSYANEQPEIVGIVSWTLYPCAKPGAPTINTRVSDYIEWINEKMDILSNPVNENDNLIVPLLSSQ